MTETDLKTRAIDAKAQLSNSVLDNLIGSGRGQAKSGKRFRVEDPATGEAVVEAADSAEVDVDEAVAAARAALETGPWSKMKPAERGKLIWALADAIDAHAEELAILESIDTGKPYQEALTIDVAGASSELRYMAGWANKVEGRTVPSSAEGDWLIYTERRPIGVVAAITPWNFPIMMVVRKVGPALAVGCTVIVKPAEQTPLTAVRFGELALEVGFPPGVVNVLLGQGETGAALVNHDGVDKVTFTGSVEVGKSIVGASAKNLKKVTLELGGKSPMIVFPDADLDAVAAGTASAIFFNAGQVCTAGSRLFVHERLREPLVERIVEIGKGLKIGGGFDDGVTLGPMISSAHRDRVDGIVQAGIAQGADLATGATKPERDGYFYAPTVLTGTKAGMDVVDQEIFGPVLCVQGFEDDDLDAVAQQANNTAFGLAGSVWTKDLSTAHKMARRMTPGMVFINLHNFSEPGMPFGGTKQSGWGRECSEDTLDAYCETRSVVVNLG